MGDLDPCKLYIKGVWSPLTTADVLECLSEYGQVTSVSHAADKGFAHVTFASSSEATRALAVTRIKNIGVTCEISRRSSARRASYPSGPAQFDLFATPSSSRGRPPSPRRRERSPSPRRRHSYNYTSRADSSPERDRDGRRYGSRSYRRSRSRSQERRGIEREDERRSRRRHRWSRSRQNSRRSRSRSPDRRSRRGGEHSRDRHQGERRRAGSVERSSRHDRRRSSTPLRAVSVIDINTSPRSPAPHVQDTRRATPSGEPHQALAPTSQPTPPPAASASPRPPAPSHHPSNRPENADSPHSKLNQPRQGSEGSVVAAEKEHSEGVAVTGMAMSEDENAGAETKQGVAHQHQQGVGIESTGKHTVPNGSGAFANERCRLAVRNLSSACSADSLRALASECGRVTHVVVHRYYVGEGLLEFGSQEEAEKALRTVNGRLLHGLTVRLQKY